MYFVQPQSNTNTENLHTNRLQSLRKLRVKVNSVLTAVIVTKATSSNVQRTVKLVNTNHTVL